MRLVFSVLQIYLLFVVNYEQVDGSFMFFSPWYDNIAKLEIRRIIPSNERLDFLAKTPETNQENYNGFSKGTIRH